MGKIHVSSVVPLRRGQSTAARRGDGGGGRDRDGQQRHPVKLSLQHAQFEGRADQQPRALLAGTGGTAESMGVLLLGGGPHLEDERHVWVVHTARRDVGGEHDALFAGPKLVRGFGSYGLGFAGVDFHHFDADAVGEQQQRGEGRGREGLG